MDFVSRSRGESAGLLAALIVTAAVALPAVAEPVEYNVTFDGALHGPAGTGTIVWDESAALMSTFTWDFGAEGSGALSTDFLNLDTGATPGGTEGEFLWDVITNVGVCGSFIGTDGIGCEAAFPLLPYQGTFTANQTGDAQFISYAPGIPSTYGIGAYGSPSLQGHITVTPVAVPEPSSGILSAFGIALAMLSATRKKQTVSK